MKKIIKIAITGGPCGGKSSSFKWISDAFGKKGYKVLFISETATELMNGGVKPTTCASKREYQVCQLKLQLQKENIFVEAAKTMPNDKIIIVCDRGVFDSRAYMDEESFRETLRIADVDEEELIKNYGAVFHLMSTAKDAPEYYTNNSNPERTETREEAIILDENTAKAWQNHPYFRIIDNSTNFQDKMKRLINEISVYLDTIEGTVM